MSKLVHEYNPNSKTPQVVVGDDLIFPGIQSCVGIFAEQGDQLVGVHLTISEKNKAEGYDKLVRLFLDQCGGQQPSTIYAIGAVTPQWHQLLKRFGAPVKYFATQGGKDFVKKGKVDEKFLIDLRVTKQSGNLKFSMQPMSKSAYHPDNAFQTIDPAILHLL